MSARVADDAAALLGRLFAGYDARLELLEREVEQLRAELARRNALDQALEPLARIIGRSTAAARAVEQRDAEAGGRLLKLAKLVGRRRLYRRAEVVDYFAERREGRG